MCKVGNEWGSRTCDAGVVGLFDNHDQRHAHSRPGSVVPTRCLRPARLQALGRFWKCLRAVAPCRVARDDPLISSTRLACVLRTPSMLEGLALLVMAAMGAHRFLSAADKHRIFVTGSCWIPFCRGLA